MNMSGTDKAMCERHETWHDAGQPCPVCLDFSQTRARMVKQTIAKRQDLREKFNGIYFDYARAVGVEAASDAIKAAKKSLGIDENMPPARLNVRRLAAFVNAFGRLAGL